MREIVSDQNRNVVSAALSLDGSILAPLFCNMRVTVLHCLSITPVCRSSISPKPDSTPVSAWLRSASKCLSTSSTSSEARPRQTSTAMWRRRRRRATQTLACVTHQHIHQQQNRLIYPFRFQTVTVCCDPVWWLKAGPVPPSSKGHRVTLRQSADTTTQPHPSHLLILSCLQYHQCHALVRQARKTKGL